MYQSLLESFGSPAEYTKALMYPSKAIPTKAVDRFRITTAWITRFKGALLELETQPVPDHSEQWRDIEMAALRSIIEDLEQQAHELGQTILTT